MSQSEITLRRRFGAARAAEVRAHQLAGSIERIAERREKQKISAAKRAAREAAEARRRALSELVRPAQAVQAGLAAVRDVIGEDAVVDQLERAVEDFIAHAHGRL